MRNKVIISGILAIIMMLTLLPACTPSEGADGYAVVIPETFPAGSLQSVGVTIFKGDQTISGNVEIRILL